MSRPIILDFGTVTFKVGLAGEKDPSFSVAPFFGKAFLDGSSNGTFGKNWLDYSVFPLNPREKHDNTIPVPAIKYVNNDFDVDYEMLDKLLEGLEGPKGLSQSFHETSVIISEPNLQHERFRHMFAELLIEKFHVERFLLSKRAPLSCYASAKTSAIVVDVGGSSSNIAAVSEGFVLQSCIQQEPVGGNLLDRIYLEYLTRHKVSIRPCFEYVKIVGSEGKSVTTRQLPFVHEKYYDWCRLYATSRLKETCIVANENLNIDIDTPDTSFALPDGSLLHADTSKALCGIYCCILFNDKQFLQRAKQYGEIAKETLYETDGVSATLDSILANTSGLGAMLNKTYKSLDLSIAHADTFNNIILSGGATRHPCVAPLLQRSFQQANPGLQPTVVAIGGPEQQYSSFIGASILSSLGSFESFCVSQKEVQEHGIGTILSRKCP